MTASYSATWPFPIELISYHVLEHIKFFENLKNFEIFEGFWICWEAAFQNIKKEQHDSSEMLLKMTASWL